MNRPRNVSIIIAVYNEEKTLGEVLEKIYNLKFLQQVIFMEDHSSDSTHAIGLEYHDIYPFLEAYRHGINQGKITAIRTAIWGILRKIL